MRNNQPVTGHEVLMGDDTMIVSNTDDKGKIQFVNKDFLDISGFNKEELVGQPHNIIRHPDMPPEAFEDMWRDLKAKLPWSGYVKNRVKNGDHYWVHANAMPVIENGRVTGYISIRTKPSPAVVKAIEPIYRKFKNGQAEGMEIKHGRVAYNDFSSKASRYFERLDNKIKTVAFLLSFLTLVVGLVGLYGGGLAWLSYVAIVMSFVAASFSSRYLCQILDTRLTYLDSRLNSIAGGKFTTEIQVGDDEMQNILTTVKALQAKLAYSELEKKEIEREKRIMQHQLADRFESEVGSVVGGISSAATELHATAGSMGETAEETSRRSTAVAAASEEATTNVQTVSAATEELAASVREIQSQVSQSTKKINDAVIQANSTNQKVQGLTEAAQKIGSVIDIIRAIAEQTNLLALNATIEAARAGESGKGFAVVASEVKNLAGQTAKATEEISQQVARIQEETRASVEAIQLITGMIDDVNKTSSAIAQSVEQQGIATQEIARNITEAAAGTQEVASNIVNVREAAKNTGAAANEVMSAAGELAKNGDILKGKVRAFLESVRKD